MMKYYLYEVPNYWAAYGVSTGYINPRRSDYSEICL